MRYDKDGSQEGKTLQRGFWGMFWIFEFAKWDLGELIHVLYLIELPDCSKMQGKILSS